MSTARGKKKLRRTRQRKPQLDLFQQFAGCKTLEVKSQGNLHHARVMHSLVHNAKV